MYFSSIPDIKYDSKPISYPFSESDYTLAKNFFRRYKIDQDVFGYATFYNKYSIQDGFKIENIALIVECFPLVPTTDITFNLSCGSPSLAHRSFIRSKLRSISLGCNF